MRGRGPAVPRHGRGATLLELVIVITLSGILLSIAFSRLQFALDRLSVRSAAVDLRSTLHSARSSALSTRMTLAVHLGDPAGTVHVKRGSQPLLSRNIGFTHGVILEHSRDSLAFGHDGLGRGAANVSIIVRRRAAVETVFVSRLGRIR